MQVAISAGLRRNRDEAVAYILEAEKLGVDSVWVGESWGTDAVTPLAYLAAKTSRVKLGTSIMQVGTRSPALIAMTAVSLAELSDDRFILGLGNSGPQVIEGWHGVRFNPPLARLRETVDIVRMALRGERVTYAGKRSTNCRCRRARGARSSWARSRARCRFTWRRSAHAVSR
jgi:alkanesulfonate monooxygenase SsuD/methylene tetrahydromethanopterin reductase-like flavin-dependent oxidoreductase (luciferase family)